MKYKDAKIGMRVRIINTVTIDSKPMTKGMAGIIVNKRYNPVVGVEWDNLTTGHSCNGLSKNERAGWELDTKHIELQLDNNMLKLKEMLLK